MTNRKFENRIGDKLRGYGEQPPPDMFSRIEKTLSEGGAPAVVPGKKRNGLLTHAYRYAAAAAILLGALFFTLRYTGESDRSGNPATAEDILNSVHTEKVDAVTLLALEEKRLADRPETIAEAIREVIIEDKLARGAVLASMAGGNDIPAAGLDMNEINEPVAEITPRSAAVTPRRDRASEEALRNRQKLEREKEIENYWADLFLAIQEEESRGGGRKLVASLYGGNFGTGTGDMVYNDLTALSANGMFRQDVSLSVPNGAPPMPPDMPSRAASSSIINPGVEASLRHRMPLNTGISIAYPISPRVSIVSGINYTYLYSSARHTLQNVPDGERKISREQHYLGLPLGVSYSFYSTKTFNFYVRGGGMIERAVYIREKEEYITHGKQSSVENKERIKPRGFQPSVDASVGANVRLGKGVGLYLEPGVAYYFENNKQEKSYRTENPTNFTVRLGVRFDL